MSGVEKETPCAALGIPDFGEEDAAKMRDITIKALVQPGYKRSDVVKDVVAFWMPTAETKPEAAVFAALCVGDGIATFQNRLRGMEEP